MLSRHSSNKQTIFNMASLGKRKALESTLQRRVRARRDGREDELVEESDKDSAPSEVGVGLASGSEDEGNQIGSGSGSGSGEEESDEEASEADDSKPEDAAAISFGALAKAQASIQKSSKGKDGSNKTSKSSKKDSDDPWMNNEAAERKAGRKDDRDFSRSSKHAPAEVSSKKAVSRRREVVPVAKRQVRDPRFEATAGQVDTAKVNKAYSFLNDYRMDEIKHLKEELKKAKDETQKERMKRQLLAMESKMKTELRKAKEQEILDKHRQEEKKLVEKGKKPFYLKKAEQKKQLIMDQYSQLKGKQLDHVIERRRKKVEGKEKKNLPYARRDFGDRS